jgi:hypothetical protein
MSSSDTVSEENNEPKFNIETIDIDALAEKAKNKADTMVTQNDGNTPGSAVINKVINEVIGKYSKSKASDIILATAVILQKGGTSNKMDGNSTSSFGETKVTLKVVRDTPLLTPLRGVSPH